ncbi:hypothetical protein PPL_09633 [Heterostelium album PN500]|uniref:Vitamin K epoxide reductase domain-containing protein n=1 Tax=Heterostelium pallidum (strain ATCC 26659 / Pp 5 / PN500) TaxID=670386 RepID=D3BNW2_HETP5|nr:hypothetical protein PPL_09633 [Heterostelium album PN500]EFA76881.1 hypothetical protein PPL_09633 [Heterostelium album PN500]|eukprot:XP_020429013.1 hypothetical protein PPL_09633 [Heterostelium album PN500]
MEIKFILIFSLLIFGLTVSIQIQEQTTHINVNSRDSLDKSDQEVLDTDSYKSMVEYLNKLPIEEIADFCEGLAKSMFSPFKCTTKEEKNELKLLTKQLIEEDESMGLKSHPKKPMVLVPGIAGSGLEGRFNKTRSPAWYCKKNVDWHRVWLSVAQIAVQECWFDNLAVFYDTNTQTYSNTEGVELQTIEFGGIKGVSYLDYIGNLPISLTNVYGDLIKFFEDLGYVAGKNIRGAPYDWRVSIKQLEKDGYFRQMKSLIENTYDINSKQKVVLISHSMGGMISLYFLNTVSQAWRDKYIDTFIPIAAPWSGSPKAIRTLISGDNLGIPLVSGDRVQNFAKESGGIIQLVPDPLVWSKETVFVSTPYKNFTIAQTSSLFSTIGLPITSKIYDGIQSVISGLKPHVPTHCIYGYGVPTEIYYKYNKGFGDQPIIFETDLGDGTVPLSSLKVCEKWHGHSFPLDVKNFHLEDHLGILSSKDVLKYIHKLIMKGSELYLAVDEMTSGSKLQQQDNIAYSPLANVSSLSGINNSNGNGNGGKVSNHGNNGFGSMSQFPNRKLLQSSIKIMGMLGLVNLAFSLYLAFGNIESGTCDVSATISCTTVIKSAFGEIAGVPVSIFGITWNIVFLMAIYHIMSDDRLPHFITAIYIWCSFGVGFVIYFVAAEYIIGALCPFCTVVHIINVTLMYFALKLYNELRVPPSLGSLLSTLKNQLIFIFVLHLVATVAFQKTVEVHDEPAMTKFAKCLTDSNMVFYGSSGCGACINQKQLFITPDSKDETESPLQYIKFVECRDDSLCKKYEIRRYPTWIKHDDNGVELERHEGVMNSFELSKMSGCEPPAEKKDDKDKK